MFIGQERKKKCFKCYFYPPKRHSTNLQALQSRLDKPSQINPKLMQRISIQIASANRMELGVKGSFINDVRL